MISLHFALPEPDHFTYRLVDVEPISLRRSLFNQGANSGDDFASSLSVIHHMGNRIPRFFQVFCIEPAQTGAGIVDECPERLIDFMGNRGRNLSQRRHPRDVSQLHLRSAKCFFGALAFDELANLTAKSSHHVEQLLVRLSYLVAKKLHHPQDVAAKQNGKSEGCVQSFACGDGRVRKISIMNNIRNVCRFMPGPDPARQPDPGHESDLAPNRFKLRDLYGFFVPNLDATKHTRLTVQAPQSAEVP